ncbi:MAG: DUF3179 domain-containing protein [Chloroflexi bacterium]|nr:DUF3179 domain-containing protein [Chloroflexota bacterium]
MRSASSWAGARRLTLAGLLVAVAVAGAAALVWPASGARPGLPLPVAAGRGGASSVDRVDARFDERRLSGALVLDDLSPLRRPASAPAGSSRLHDETLVVGVALGEEAKAYPITVLQRHEIVNDDVGGVPVLVTWCPVCGTALVHDRRIDGRTYSFGNYRALYENAMTWYDHETLSLWSQPSGVALRGPLAGVRLGMLPARLATWGDWKREQPHTLVLAEGFGSDSEERTNPLADSPEAFVIGVVVAGGAKAYPLDVIAGAAVNDEVAGVPVLVYARDRGASVYVFDRRVSGDPLTFEWAGEQLRDRETRSLWDASTGEAVEGRWKGAVLRRVPYGTAFGWAWRAFYPDAGVYEPPRES